MYDKRIATVLEDCDDAELEAFCEILRTTKAIIRKKQNLKPQ